MEAPGLEHHRTAGAVRSIGADTPCRRHLHSQHQHGEPMTRSELMQLVDYSPETGILRAKVRRTSTKEILGSKSVRQKRVYLRVCINRKHYYAHRLAWFYVYGKWPKLLDHINGDGCDNRISNLREASHSENHANQRIRQDSATKLKGVSVQQNGKFRAVITKNGRDISLGTFKTAGEAHAAYVSAARRLFGEFANGGLGA